jgi:hypothetical protein
LIASLSSSAAYQVHQQKEHPLSVVLGGFHNSFQAKERNVAPVEWAEWLPVHAKYSPKHKQIFYTNINHLLLRSLKPNRVFGLKAFSGC